MNIELPKGPPENPDRELALADAAAHRDGLVNSPHFLKILVDNARSGLLSCEPHLTPDGNAAVGIQAGIVLVDQKKACNVRYLITVQVNMAEEAIVEPPNTGLIVPDSLEGLLAPRPPKIN